MGCAWLYNIITYQENAIDVVSRFHEAIYYSLIHQGHVWGCVSYHGCIRERIIICPKRTIIHVGNIRNVKSYQIKSYTVAITVREYPKLYCNTPAIYRRVIMYMHILCTDYAHSAMYNNGILFTCTNKSVRSMKNILYTRFHRALFLPVNRDVASLITSKYSSILCSIAASDMDYGVIRSKSNHNCSPSIQPLCLV